MSVVDIILRFTLSVYRQILFFIFGRMQNQVMPNNVELCTIDTGHRDFDKYHGDIIHPCVRYSEKKFRGSNWWMIYTPYYNSDSSLENPILCYGISLSSNIAPINWTIEKEIIGTPNFGYNSDPTMFYDKNELNIFWRENETPRTEKNKIIRGTYGTKLSNDFIEFPLEHPLLYELDKFVDKEVSPTIIKYKNGYRAYAMHLRFKNQNLVTPFKTINILIRKSLWILSVLDIYSDQKSYGIAIWDSDTLDENFKYVKTTTLQNCNRLYRPWHMDIFEYDNLIYAVMQTKQCDADIVLAVSKDGENFTMYPKPLITNKGIKKVGIYKPTALVHNNIFHLYYTAQDFNDRSLNKLYMTSMPFDELLSKLQ